MSNISVYKKIKYYIDGNTTIQTYRNNFHQILANCRLRLSLFSETPKQNTTSLAMECHCSTLYRAGR